MVLIDEHRRMGLLGLGKECSVLGYATESLALMIEC
jgi:hypothetical protein